MEVLVLGQSYEPIERVGWKRAMVLWAGGRVEVLETWDGRFIRTPRLEIPLPSVVRYLRAHRRNGAALRFSKESVYARDRGHCQYCQRPVSRREGTYDHIVPRSRGGDTRWENIVLACRACNLRKGARTPAEADMALVRAPVRPAYGSWQALLGQGDALPRSWRPYLGLAE